MKCTNCSISVAKAMLHRTEPIGCSNAKFMCMKCIKKLHPELSANILEEKIPLETDLEKMFYENN